MKNTSPIFPTIFSLKGTMSTFYTDSNVFNKAIIGNKNELYNCRERHICVRVQHGIFNI